MSSKAPPHEPVTPEEGVAAAKRGDYDRAFQIFHKLSEDGDAEAQHCLGLMYHHGDGVYEDHIEAAKWYLKAAEQDHTLAQTNLASLYTGTLHFWKFSEGLEYYELAAKKDDALAQFNLGRLLSDHDAAIGWYSRSAELGYPPAMDIMGSMYSEGNAFIKCDLVQSLKWFTLAKDYNYMAASNVEDVREKMSASEIEEAERLVSEWLEQFYKKHGVRYGDGKT